MYWDVLITLILLVSCIQTPIDIAFSGSASNQEWSKNDYLNTVMDLMFLVDILVCFFSAYDIDDEIIDDRKRIAINYLTGWFLVDTLAIFPVNLFLGGNGDGTSNYNELVRIIRLGKLTKLLKFLKLLRLIKVLKQQNKIMN
jgi:hypothetical protein